MNMGNFDQLFDSISANVPLSESEYIGDNGLLHCSACHKQTQTEVEFLGVKKIVRCICDCRKKEMEAHKGYISIDDLNETIKEETGIEVIGRR